jgi:hypothetical protein
MYCTPRLEWSGWSGSGNVIAGWLTVAPAVAPARGSREAVPACLRLPAMAGLLLPLRLALLLAATLDVQATLLLDEDFSCASMGCNASHGITNYSYWRWSTTGSRQAHMAIRPASGGRTGNEIDFSVDWCPPPNPNPKHLGCYRSELALQRAVESSLIDWTRGVGSSVRWFGFSNRLQNYSWDSAVPLNGPSFQLHAAGALPAWKGKHPVLNLQVDATGCAERDTDCPKWTLGISGGGTPHPGCSEGYDMCWVLGPAMTADGLDGWNDWVISWQGSPLAERGHVAVWRNGKPVLSQQTLMTAYNDSAAPYLKFGIYHSGWKGSHPASQVTARHAGMSYGAVKVGDETSSFDEVSTRQAPAAA